MNSLRGYLIIAGAIVLAGMLIAYHPFQKTQPHFQLIVRDDGLIQFDPTTGQVWVWGMKATGWQKLSEPQMSEWKPPKADTIIKPANPSAAMTNQP